MPRVHVQATSKDAHHDEATTPYDASRRTDLQHSSQTTHQRLVRTRHENGDDRERGGKDEDGGVRVRCKREQRADVVGLVHVDVRLRLLLSFVDAIVCGVL